MLRVQAQRVSFEYVEPKWAQLQALLGAGKEQQFAACEWLWGPLPQQHAGFISAVAEHIAAVQKEFPPPP